MLQISGGRYGIKKYPKVILNEYAVFFLFPLSFIQKQHHSYIYAYIYMFHTTCFYLLLLITQNKKRIQMATYMPIIINISLAMMVVFTNGIMAASPQFSAMFVFGDSLTDAGNNNYLNSLAKANYVPYGIDFVEGPSGRFCNGRTIVDFLGKYSSH